MNRCVSGPRHWCIAALLAGLAGCMEPVTRPQAADEPERDRYNVQTIGDISRVGNAQPVPLAGIGVVIGLNGCGGEATGDYLAAADHELQRNPGLWKEIKEKTQFAKIKEFLASPDVTVVQVRGTLLPGSSKNDKIDVDVMLPPKTRATSLRGGYLLECVLYNYDTTGNLTPNSTGPGSFLRGHPVARAAGPILVGLGDGDERLRSKRGRIWNGGQLHLDWPLSLTLNEGFANARWVSIVTTRINDVLEDGPHGADGGQVAKVRDMGNVPVTVPAQYKLNQQHFFRVVRAIPLYDVADRVEGDGRTYRQRLAADLLDPARTLSAALRLEALGSHSVSQLLPGLKSPHPLVRFAAAQSLAYLNCPSAAEELKRLIMEYAALRAFALSALASLDELSSDTCLVELLNSPSNDETRYGAFRALRTRNEHNPLIRGDFLNDSFWFHRVAPNAAPFIHVSTTKRAEIVLFGEEPMLLPPFSFLAGEFTVTATAGEDCCRVSRIPASGPPSKRQCSLRLEEVVRAMADMGAVYPDVVEFLKQGEKCKCLSAHVRFNALPQATDIMELAKAGKGQSDILKTVTPSQGDTPTLFEAGVRTSSPPPTLPPGGGE